MEEPLSLGSEGECNCQYRVISYQATGTQTPGHFEFRLFGDEQVCPLGCRYFQGYTGDCIFQSGTPDPNCDNAWTSFPTPYYDFNCYPSQNSSFGIELERYWIYGNCNYNGTIQSYSVTFEIRCSRENPSTACREGELFSVSRTITSPETKATLLISGQSLTQCGCIPSFAERE